MAKRVIVVFVVLIYTLTAFSQDWQFQGSLPDTTVFPTGWDRWNQGLAIDGEGKIWYTSYFAVDTMKVDYFGDGSWFHDRPCRAIYVFNPDGSQASFSPINTITVNGITDTLWGTSRGLHRDPDGNIVAGSHQFYYRINYLTGEGMDKLVPYPNEDTPADLWDGATVVTPAFDTEGNMYCNPVDPTFGGIKAFNSNWELIDELIPMEMLQGFSRSIEVTPDGRDIYFADFWEQGWGLIRYHSDSGLGGDYTSNVDSLLPGTSVETMAWQPRSGLLWVGHTKYDRHPTSNTSCSFYAFDPLSDIIVDSVNVPHASILGARPRGIDFSEDGNTMYLSFFFSDSTYPVYVFHNKQPKTVAFKLNMDIQESIGQFDPEVDYIELRGTFNSWSSDTTIVLKKDRAQNVYYTTVDFSAFSTESHHEYKFVIVKPTAEILESGDHRFFAYNGSNMYLPEVWFDNIAFPEDPPDDKNVLQVLPADTLIKTGQTIQYEAFFPGSIGNDISLDTNIMWSIDGMPIGSIDENGLFTSDAEGFALVTAQIGEYSGTAFMIAERAETDSFTVNSIEISRDSPNPNGYSVMRRLEEGDIWRMAGLPSPLNVLNGSAVYFPHGSLHEDIRIHVSLPEFFKSGKDSIETATHHVVAGVDFEVIVEDSTYATYSFDEALIVGIVYKRGLIENMGIEPENLSLYYAENQSDLLVIDSLGLSYTTVDLSQNKIFSAVPHFTSLVVGSPKQTLDVNDDILKSPESFILHQNYPNPFNPTTTIQYSLLETGSLKLSVFDIRGKEIAILQNTMKPAGNYKVLWNGIDDTGRQVATGVYFARLQAGEYSSVVKMLYLK